MGKHLDKIKNINMQKGKKPTKEEIPDKMQSTKGNEKLEKALNKLINRKDIIEAMPDSEEKQKDLLRVNKQINSIQHSITNREKNITWSFTGCMIYLIQTIRELSDKVDELEQRLDNLT
jgi:hypothetical protein